MNGKRVLIADDEIHIVHVVTIKLRNNGYDVITAEDGSEAYDLACEERPDIIITDYQMPVMTGIELVEKLRTNEQTKEIPVIMLTARSYAVSPEQRERLCIHNCLSKPFSPRELLGNVEDALFQTGFVPQPYAASLVD